MTGGGAIPDLRGDSRRHARDRLMRRLFRAAASATIVVSILILFVLVRGAVDFMRSVGWDFGILRDSSKAPGWFPRRERFDLLTIVLGMGVYLPLHLGLGW